MSESLQISREGRVLRLVLNRPERRNALNMELCSALGDALAGSGRKRMPAWEPSCLAATANRSAPAWICTKF